VSQGRGLAFLEALGPQKIRPGLSRTRALLEGLGSPERSFRTVLIAGTNGKGSTAAFASSLLTAAGLRTGLYTSPHLVRVTERVRIAEEDVAAARLDDVLGLVSDVAGAGGLAPTYFEAMTVSAFELFRRARVAVAVVEVGIGGRLDATNVLEPEVSVVTNVGADHLEVLGPTLQAVAREKAGVFRRGQPAITGERGPLLEILEEEARRSGARLFAVPPTERFARECPLDGRHQRANLALALAAAASFGPMSDEAILKGVASVRWPGRLQRIVREGRRPLLLDGAHNPDGARSLAAWLDDAGLSRRVDMVFGGLADKSLEEVFAPLGPRVRRVVLTAPSSPRAEDPRRLAARIGRPDALCAPGVAGALARLDAEGPGDGAPIIVTGSLFLVGDALALLERT
jgi:dihydrofolate synthase/folylpolyglutamate synthase